MNILHLNKINTLLHWLKKPSVVWVLFCSIFLAYIIIAFSKNEFCARLVGFLFQFVGFGCSFCLLLRAEKYFNYPNIATRVKDWIKQCPLLKTEQEHLSIEEFLPPLKGYGEAHNFFTPDNRGVDSRIKAIESYICYLDGRVTHLKNALNEKIKEIERDAHIERGVRISRDGEIENMLKDSAIGSAVLAELSIAYFVVGSIISNFAPDIMECLK